MRLFGVWSRGKRATRKQQHKNTRCYRPRLEILEDRLTPASFNDFYVVPGASTVQVPVHFNWDFRGAAFNNSLIVYTVTNLQGEVLGTAPTEEGYARSVATVAQTVFRPGEGTGTQRTILFAGGTILGFGLVTNAPLETWRAARTTSAANVYGGSVAWLSFNGDNPEEFDPVLSNELAPGFKQFFFEDHAGSALDYTDMVFTVSPTGDRAFAIPGLTGQVTPATFDLLGRFSGDPSELGLFFVNNMQGQLGTLFPGDEGYLEQALAPANTLDVFSLTDPVGTSRTLTLPSNRAYGLFLVRGGTVEDLLAVNPSNIPGLGVEAFFFFPEMNFDDQPHFRQLSPGVYGVEDTTNGDFDFNDLIFRVSYGAAVGDVFPPVITARLLNDTGTLNNDQISADPTVTGTVTDAESTIGALEASVDSTDPTDLVDVFGDFNPATGTFELNRTRLEAILGATLNDGQHTVRLRARDSAGNVTQLFPFTFTVDTTVTPAPTVTLAAESDSGVQGDLTTFLDDVTLNGSTEANATVVLNGPNALQLTTTTNAQGQFTFSPLPLDLGANNYTLQVTDRAGNQLAAPFAFTITQVANSVPTFTGTIANINTGLNDEPDAVELNLFFSDADTGHSLVRFDVQFGGQTNSFDFELFDREAPATVANFFNYIQDGRYDDSIFHRSAETQTGAEFVLQGGGFTFDTTPQFVDVPADPTIPNEFSAARSNVRGTVAMAKLGNDPDSASSEFFVNLNNNSANLDNQNGGFTVFGRVVAGQDVIDQIAAQPTQDRDPATPPASLSPFGELPVYGDLPAGNTVESPANSGQYPLPAGAQEDNFASITNVQIVRTIDRLSFTIEIISESTPGFVNAVTEVNNRLIINPTQTGTATVQIRATDEFGNSVVSNQFIINIV